MKLFPKDIPEFSYLKTVHGCIDLYLIDESYSNVLYNGVRMPMCVGQSALRRYLNVNYRVKENPWCVVQNETNPSSFNYGKLTMTAIWSWSYYSNFQKVAAFFNNKLIALKHSSKNNPDFIWWDRQNFPYQGIPFVVDGLEVEIDDNTGEVLHEASR